MTRYKICLVARAVMAPPLALLALLAAGCASPEADAPGSREEAGGLHLRLSVEAGGYTRAGAAADGDAAEAERRIDNVLVMLFAPGDAGRPGALLMSRAAESLTADAGEGAPRRFDVRIPVSSARDFPDRMRVMALANGAHLAGRLSAMEGNAYSVIRKDAALWRDEKGDESGPLFTMWGAAPDLVEKDARVQNVSMRMLRDMAKVTVAIPVDGEGNSIVEGDAGFRLAHALVYNRRGEVSVLPDMAGLAYPGGDGAGPDPYGVVAPAVMKDVNGKTLLEDLKKDEGYSDALSPAGLTSVSLYVPEQDILLGEPASADDENAMRRPALIVGGYNGGDTDRLTWYRVDFTGGRDPEGNPVLADVLRNHHYRVCVKGVNGPGEETPELAYSTLQAKVEADVVDWTEVEWDAEFDGASWIAAQREVAVGASAGDLADVVLRSNVDSASWTFSWDEDGEGLFEAEIQPDLSDKADESDKSERTRVVITTLQDLPADMERRAAVLTVTVTPKLRFIINVIQTRGDSGGDSDDTHDPWKDDYLYWIL